MKAWNNPKHQWPINCNKSAKTILFNGDRTVSSTNGAGTTGKSRATHSCELLGHSPAHLFTYYPRLLLSYYGRVEQAQQRWNGP
jgi:hypothetical protein